MAVKPLTALMLEAQATSERYHKLANLVSTRVDDFDAWLASLPGKIEVETSTANPDYHPDYGDDPVLVVGIKRLGKEWCLAVSVATETGDPDFPYANKSEWKPVRSASLRLKSAVLQVLPELVEIFLSHQKSLIDVMKDIPLLEQVDNAKKGGK